MEKGALPPVDGLSLDGRSLDDLVTAASHPSPTEVLAAATRGITRLLGDRGSCVLVDEQPRVVLALDRPALSDVPIDLDRYPEVRTAVETRQLVAVDDVQRDERLAAVRALLPAELRSVVAVPLVAEDQCLAVVHVQSLRAHPSSPAARAAALLLARLAAQLFARRLGEGAVTAFVSEPVSAPVATTGAAPPLGGRILIVEDDVATAEALAETLAEEGYHIDRATDGAECLRQAAGEAPDLVLLDVNLPGMSGFDTAAQLRRATPTRGVPILFLSAAGDLPARVRGVRLEQVDFMPKPFSLDELLARIQQALGQGRARRKLQRAAEQDELTGLGNLRLLHRRAASERARFSRYGHPLSIAMIDVDKLKTINDVHGHVAGSEALRGIAGVLRRQARDIDLVVRYGGDEFVALLPHTGLADARIFGRRVRSEVAALAPQGVPLSVSIGLAALTRPNSLESIEELLRRADRAAYCSKQAGGNRVTVDDEEPE